MNVPRSIWTPAQVERVRTIFGPEGVAEALDLFAPDDWSEFCEVVPAGQLVGVLVRERDSLRRKAARHRAGAQMGFSPAEIALAGAKAHAIRDTGGAS